VGLLEVLGGWGVLLGPRLSRDRRGDRRPLGTGLRLPRRRVPAP